MTARRLLFHIGLPKTGTTTLQHALHASRDTLRAAGILYPDPLHFRSHKALLPHLAGAQEAGFRTVGRLGRTEQDRREAAARMWAGIKAQVAAEAPETIILSAEQFQRRWTPQGAADIAALLSEIADDIIVVAYLRAPAPSFLAKLQQQVKFRPTFELPPPDRYRGVLEPFLGRPEMRVAVQVFERERLHGGDIVTDFCARHLPGFDPGQLTRPGADSNESISPEAMALLQEVNAGTRRFPQRFIRAKTNRAVRMMRRADPLVPGFRKPALRPGFAAALHARATDLDWLDAEFGLRFPAPPDGPAPGHALEELSRVGDFVDVDEDRKARLWAAALKTASAESALGAQAWRQIRAFLPKARARR